MSPRAASKVATPTRPTRRSRADPTGRSAQSPLATMRAAATAWHAAGGGTTAAPTAVSASSERLSNGTKLRAPRRCEVLRSPPDQPKRRIRTGGPWERTLSATARSPQQPDDISAQRRSRQRAPDFYARDHGRRTSGGELSPGFEHLHEVTFGVHPHFEDHWELTAKAIALDAEAIGKPRDRYDTTEVSPITT